MNQHENITVRHRILSGIPLSDGKGEGRIWHAYGGVPKRFRRTHIISENHVMGEIGKMRHAVQLVSLVLENSIRQVNERLGKSYADMFGVLVEMLHDPSLLDAILEQIELRHHDAGNAITTVFDTFRTRLAESPSPYLRERANDLLGLQGSLLDALISSDHFIDTMKSDQQGKGKITDAIAVVETLTPRLVLDLKNTQVSGIACEQAGPTSHAAILCRAFGIPAVEGLKHILQQLPQGGYAVIDGASGTIWAADRRKILNRALLGANRPGVAGEKSMDLSHITLMANLNLAQNAITALEAGAQGIGLYRTEFEYMVANRLLTTQEQFVCYRNVVIAMMGLPVTIRLIDISADKSAEIFNSIDGRIDPSCGGALFLLSRPELLEAQARAIAEAAGFGPVRVLYPMVADTEQFLCLKTAFCNAVVKELSVPIQHGAMIEQPSAVEDARGILEEADFACLGTNDLTKHLLHVDRETAVAHSAEIVRSPKLWDAIGHVARVASTFGKQLTVCGEMASDLRLLTRFTDIGIHIFSMDIRKIRSLRKRTAESATE
jgi:phosphoenolpyruvate-protein kinase (PTS system EI component)